MGVRRMPALGERGSLTCARCLLRGAAGVAGALPEAPMAAGAEPRSHPAHRGDSNLPRDGRHRPIGPGTRRGPPRPAPGTAPGRPSPAGPPGGSAASAPHVPPRQPPACCQSSGRPAPPPPSSVSPLIEESGTASRDGRSVAAIGRTGRAVPRARPSASLPARPCDVGLAGACMPTLGSDWLGWGCGRCCSEPLSWRS